MRSKRILVDSWPLFCATSLVAVVLLGASAALSIVDAVTLELKVKTWGAISIAAAATQSVAVIGVVALNICRLGCSSVWMHRWVLPWASALVGVIGAIFVVNAIALKAAYSDEVRRQHGRINIVGQGVACGLAVVVQLAFHILVMLKQEATNLSQLQPRDGEIAQPKRPTSPLMALRLVPSASKPKDTPTKPSPLSESDLMRASWKDSLLSLRPNGTHFKTHSSRPSLSRDSSVRSAQTTISDPFDSWDIEVNIPESTASLQPTRGTALETIPQSRPSSPAKALDGPFPSSDNETPILQIPARPSTARSQTSPSYPIKITFVPAARPESQGADESHIHPLFRTDSPTPPPAISRDTIVTASPIGGQSISAPVLSRPSSRKRSASQLLNRSPYVTSSRCPSRASSLDNLSVAARRAQSIDERRPISPNNHFAAIPAASSAFHLLAVASEIASKKQAELNEAVENGSPISRGCTPPIPEFILSARQEGSRTKRSRETLRSSPHP